MAAIFGKLWDIYNLLFEELPDARTKPWFLVAKPYQMLTLLALYLAFILKWGPEWMRRRPAFNLNKVMIVYNFLQVMVCSYIFVKGIEYAWGWKYKWFCEPVDTSPNGRKIASVSYLYYLTKVVDLLDTVFFVLRKKHKQVSFLHIYHHAGMVVLIWGAVTYFPGGHGTLVGVINCFVHIVMYSYYLYTAAVPSAKNSLWWKKYITQLQIIQFFWCVVHMGALAFIQDCKYPRWVVAVFLPQNLFILILFIDFYIKTYIRKPSQKQTELKNGHIHKTEYENDSKMTDGQSNEDLTGKTNKASWTRNALKENGHVSSAGHKIE